MGSTYSSLLYLVIFSTKHREPLITPTLSADLYPYIGGILRRTEWSSLEIGGMPDHVHLIIQIRPDTSVAEIVRLVKSNSSEWVQ